MEIYVANAYQMAYPFETAVPIPDDMDAGGTRPVQAYEPVLAPRINIKPVGYPVTELFCANMEVPAKPVPQNVTKYCVPAVRERVPPDAAVIVIWLYPGVMEEDDPLHRSAPALE